MKQFTNFKYSPSIKWRWLVICIFKVKLLILLIILIAFFRKQTFISSNCLNSICWWHDFIDECWADIGNRSCYEHYYQAEDWPNTFEWIRVTILLIKILRIPERSCSDNQIEDGWRCFKCCHWYRSFISLRSKGVAIRSLIYILLNIFVHIKQFTSLLLLQLWHLAY